MFFQQRRGGGFTFVNFYILDFTLSLGATTLETKATTMFKMDVPKPLFSNGKARHCFECSICTMNCPNTELDTSYYYLQVFKRTPLNPASLSIIRPFSEKEIRFLGGF